MTAPYTLRPISDRTHFTGKHRLSNFDTPWPDTERLLIREVRQLQGKDLVIEADFTEVDIRQDGRIRASARPSTPAVRIAFDSIHGPLIYATDRFTWWQDNVRAIALGLEALRKVDRYGITKRGEQYKGWKALPSGSGAGASHMTNDDAIAVLAAFSEETAVEINYNSHTARRAFKTARARTHPDHNDGDRTLWDQVEQAAKVLGLV